MLFCVALVHVFCCFYSDKDYNTMLTAVSLLFDILNYYVRLFLFCSYSYETVKQVRGSASYKTRSISENKIENGNGECVKETTTRP